MRKTANIEFFLKLYIDKGLSIIPLGYKSKRPVTDWKRYQYTRPSREELEKWFSDGRKNIGIVTGRVSNNLVVIDFDDANVFQEWKNSLSEDLRRLLDWTWIVKTAKGYHVYFYVPETVRTKPKLRGGIDIKAEGGYVVAPPSIHPSGPQYLFLTDPEITDIYKLNRDEWSRIKESLGWKEEEIQNPINEAGEGRRLTEDEIYEIVDLVSKIYRKNFRDLIIFGLTGWLRKAGISYESAYKIIDLLTVNDEERKHRFYVLDRTYNKLPLDIDLKGFKQIEEIIDKLSSRNKTKIMLRLSKIIGVKPPELTVVKSDMNNPLRKTIRLTSISLVHAETRQVFEDEGDGVLTLREIEVLFRIYKAYPVRKGLPVLIFDNDGYINIHRREYALQPINKDILDILEKSKLSTQFLASIVKRFGYNIDKNTSRTDILRRLYELKTVYTPVPLLKNVDFLKGFDWRKLIDEIVDYKAIKIDPRLKIVRKATLLRGLRQEINPHGIIVLPGQTGKSSWYKAIGHIQDSVTAKGLLGYADTEGEHPGAIDGTELPFAIDQIENNSAYQVLRYLFNIMEYGSATVTAAAISFEVTSKSIFIILSNPIGDPRRGFEYLLAHLTRNPTLGRRFGVILYDKEAVRIEKREKDLFKQLSEKIKLFRAVEDYARKELVKIVEDDIVWEWLNTKNSEWLDHAKKVLDSLEDDSDLKEFLLEFIENGWTHIKGAALYCALVDNLDKIALREYDIENIIAQAEEYLTEILDINYNSVTNLVSDFEETKEERIKRTFAQLPQYLREIVSAVEHFRRSLSEEEREEIKLPYELYLKKLPYKPEKQKYLSKILTDIIRRGNPTKWNNDLKKLFGFELVIKDREVYAVLHSVDLVDVIEPIGEFDNSRSDISEFSDIVPGKGYNQLDEVKLNNNDSDKVRKVEKSTVVNNKNSPPRPYPKSPKTPKKEDGLKNTGKNTASENNVFGYPKSNIYKNDKNTGSIQPVSKKCRNCIFHRGTKCLLHRELTVVSPEYNCSNFVSSHLGSLVLRIVEQRQPLEKEKLLAVEFSEYTRDDIVRALYLLLKAGLLKEENGLLWVVRNE
ncbi:MAG: bifunctional DNA primase/polymerase [Thermoproteales archaeon]|nr:bifunctional DNA primase/polymerase [Thermoproteales archaeon]